MSQAHKDFIVATWSDRQNLNGDQKTQLEKVLPTILHDLSAGRLQVVAKADQDWEVQEWVKMAILLSFRVFPATHRPEGFNSFDKLGLRFDGWGADEFATHQIRALPGAIVRQGAYVGKDVVLMPSFINVGAHVGDGTMIDTWATVGSCAYVGKNCHISGGVGLGGVLEPLQACPVIIEDNCFIGARSEVVEGVHIGQGAVLGMGVFIGASTPIVNRENGEIIYGYVPPYSVVLSGSMPTRFQGSGSAPHLACAVIVKQVDAQTRSKTSVNDLLRSANDERVA